MTKRLALATILTFFAVAGCNQVKTQTTNDWRTIPEGLGQFLPAQGQPAGTPRIAYDSLYVSTWKSKNRTMLVDYLRFWPNGRVLRQAGYPAKPNFPAAADGDYFAHATVGRWSLVNDELLIEFYEPGGDGWVFCTFTGAVTDEGISLTQQQINKGRDNERETPPKTINTIFKRKPVGPMEMDADW